MEGPSTRQKLNKAKKYLSLNSQLEDIADERLTSLLRFSRKHLEQSIREYSEFISIQNEPSRLLAESDQRNANTLYNAKTCLDKEEGKRKIQQLSQKSDEARRRYDISQAIRNATLSAIYLPFSRKKAAEYKELTKDYITSAWEVHERMQTKKRVASINKNTKKIQREAEQLRRENIQALQEKGIDKETAEHIFEDFDNSPIYITLDRLKEHYELE